MAKILTSTKSASSFPEYDVITPQKSVAWLKWHPEDELEKIRRRYGDAEGQNCDSLYETYCLTIIGFQTVKIMNTFLII